MHLTIANLDLDIISQGLPIILDDNPAYTHFVSTDKPPDTETINVRLWIEKRMVPASSLQKIFDTSESWKLYTDSLYKYITFQPDDTNSEPIWSMRINNSLKEVDVYCGNAFLRQSSDGKMLVNPVQYPLDQLLITNLLIGRGLLMHAAGVVINGRGYLFAGPSGAGKSTFSSLVQNKNGLTLLSDDRIVVQKTGQDILMYGTPWPGEAAIAVNDRAKLHGIFFLNHSNANKIRKLTISETLESFFKVSSLPLYDKADSQKSFDFCEELLNQVQAFELNFKPGPEIVNEFLSFIKT